MTSASDLSWTAQHHSPLAGLWCSGPQSQISSHGRNTAMCRQPQAYPQKGEPACSRTDTDSQSEACNGLLWLAPIKLAKTCQHPDGIRYKGPCVTECNAETKQEDLESKPEAHFRELQVHTCGGRHPQSTAMCRYHLSTKQGLCQEVAQELACEEADPQ